MTTWLGWCLDHQAGSLEAAKVTAREEQEARIRQRMESLASTSNGKGRRRSVSGASSASKKVRAVSNRHGLEGHEGRGSVLTLGYVDTQHLVGLGCRK